MTTKVTIVVSNGNAPVDVKKQFKVPTGWVHDDAPPIRVYTGGVHQEYVHGSRRLVIEEVKSEPSFDYDAAFRNPLDMKVGWPHGEASTS